MLNTNRDQACVRHGFRGRKASFLLALAATLAFMLLGPAHSVARTIVFVDWSWDSAQIHNRIAGFIVEHGYGYDVDYIFADTVPGLLGMRNGDIHVSMEMWTDNFKEIWEEALAQGDLLDLGPNYPNAPQGWYVPTYLVEGDPERGIVPLAPDLRSVNDLPRYWDLFRDPEQPSRGRFYNAPTGWVAHDINNAKLEAYGLLDSFVSFSPGSQAALDASIAGAYNRGQPWVGYYWEPSGIMGMFDMTMLEEPEYTDKCWDTDFGCAYPNVSVRVGVYSGLADASPELVEFFANYETTLEQTNAVLKYYETDAMRNMDRAARWFLNEYEDLWTGWVPEDVAGNVKAALRK